MAVQQRFTINTPLLNYFLYKEGPKMNTPLVGGTIDFFRADDHAQRAATYSDVSDPNNPVLNSNPIVLDANGSCPVIYLQDIPYFVVIKSFEGQVVITYTNYRGATFNQDTNNINDSTNNILPNGQFSYPITFSRTDQAEGQITEGITNVAFGWYFAQDFGSEVNKVNFLNIANQLIEGSPQFECSVTSASSLSETVKYLASIYGSVTSFEGSELTFSIQLRNNNFSGEVPISITVEKNYGTGGSPTEIISITTFNASPTRTKFRVSFTNPPSVGKVVGPGNYAALRVNFPLNQSFSVGLTNNLLELGSIDNPIYIGQDFSMEVSQILGSSTTLEGSGLKDNYSQMTYSDGLYFPLAQTGIISLSAAGVDFPDKLEIETPGQTLPVSGYSEKNIPFRRLYNVIGNTYGGSNAYDLIVTSNGNVVTFTSAIGARQISDYTNGDIGSGYVVANPVVGLRYQFNLEIDPLDDTKVIMTWLDTFAINQTPGGFTPVVSSGAIGNYFRAGASAYNPSSWGSQSITVTTINPGSPSDSPIASINFVSENLNSYRTFVQIVTYVGLIGEAQILGNGLDFGINASNNTRGNYSRQTYPSVIAPTFSPAIIRFRVDGTFGPMPGFVPESTLYSIDFNILTSQSLEQNIKRFISEIANPFVWTITINSAPLASQYFLYSSGPSDTGTEYYGWYRVNGVGTDPAVPDRTGIMIDILSTDSTAVIAEKTADAVNSLSFNLPTPGVNLPELPEDSKSSYYINL